MTVNQIGRPKLKRLIHLRGLVENCPSEKFDMCDWDRGDTKCAGGLAMTDPMFNKMGLRRRLGGPNLEGYSSKILDRKGRPPLGGFSDHLAQFFGLTYLQARKLFCPTESSDGWSISEPKAQRLWMLGQLNRIIAKEYNRRAVQTEEG